MRTELKPEVRFFRKPPPQTNFVRFTGLLQTFAIVPYGLDRIQMLSDGSFECLLIVIRSHELHNVRADLQVNVNLVNTPKKYDIRFTC